MNKTEKQIEQTAKKLNRAIKEHIEIYGDAIDNQYLMTTNELLGVDSDCLTEDLVEVFLKTVKKVNADNYEIYLKEYAVLKYNIQIKQLYDNDGNAIEY